MVNFFIYCQSFSYFRKVNRKGFCKGVLQLCSVGIPIQVHTDLMQSQQATIFRKCRLYSQSSFSLDEITVNSNERKTQNKKRLCGGFFAYCVDMDKLLLLFCVQILIGYFNVILIEKISTTNDSETILSSTNTS